MPLINTFSDYEEYIDLLTQQPSISVFLRAYSNGMSLDDASNFYGKEMVSLANSSPRLPVTVGFSISKEVLIEDMAQFVGNNKPLFSSTSIEGLAAAIKIACLGAENAVADKDGNTIPDPRFRTCVAGAQALASLASAYASNSPSGDTAAKYAIESLVDLGLSNNQNLDLNLRSNDTGIIGYSYLRELIGLASDPQTAPLVASVLAEKKTKHPAADHYIASIAFCSLVLEDASAHKKHGLRQLASLLIEFNPGRPLYLFTEGMKIEKQGAQEAEMISAILCGMVNHKGLRDAANQLVSWTERHVQSESQRIHHKLVGENLPYNGQLIVAEMKRTLQQQNSFLGTLFQGSDPAPPR